MMEAVLQVRDLHKVYQRRRGLLQRPVEVSAVRGVSFELGTSEVLALVGESGCGKSTVGKIVADVVPPSSGEILLDGRDLNSLRGGERDRFSRRIQIIHQDPYAALNPVRTVAQTLAAPLQVVGVRGGDVWGRAQELLELVGLVPGRSILPKYPHQLSGGQRQRVVIARALAVNPDVLVADEATSMVDVSLRIGILDTLHELRNRLGVALLFITHDFGVARYFAHGQRLAVMYLGQFVEVGRAEEVIARPRHPYTLMLLSAIPMPDPRRNRERKRLLPASDEVPDATVIPEGCPFAGRCPFATDRCRHEAPALVADGASDHLAACHYPERVAEATAELQVN
jgi:oligopeptide/dipeptide ABC transporter ATP-binding protein